MPDYSSLVADRPEKEPPMTSAQLERLSRKLVRKGMGEIVEPPK